VPAAAVIPAPIAYIKVVAVKKLVVGFRGVSSLWRPFLFSLQKEGRKWRAQGGGDVLQRLSRFQPSCWGLVVWRARSAGRRDAVLPSPHKGEGAVFFPTGVHRPSRPLLPDSRSSY